MSVLSEMPDFCFLLSLGLAAPSPLTWSRNGSHTEMAHYVSLTSKKLKERCYRAWSQSGGWWMALSSLIVLPSSTEREQISARAEWCVWPLLLSYSAPGSLMWLSLYCRCKDRKSKEGQIARLREMGRLRGSGRMRRDRKQNEMHQRQRTVSVTLRGREEISAVELLVFTNCR